MINEYIGHYGWWLIFYGAFALGASVCLILAIYANVTYRRYFCRDNAAGITGEQAAARILEKMGNRGIPVCHKPGNKTDAYNEAEKKIQLSDAVFAYRSVGAAGVAGHTCAHLVPRQKGRGMYKFQRTAVPLAEFFPILAWPLIVIGYLFGKNWILVNFGILCFLFALLLRLITLPFEYSTALRAQSLLADAGIAAEDELLGIKKLLRASALGYLAKALGI